MTDALKRPRLTLGRIAPPLSWPRRCLWLVSLCLADLCIGAARRLEGKPEGFALQPWERPDPRPITYVQAGDDGP